MRSNMKNVIGIRKEEKNEFEKRTAISPSLTKKIVADYGGKVLVEKSSLRIFKEEDYKKAGAEIVDNLSKADVIFGVKEVPIESIIPGKTYVFFSHTVKGQKHNMPMLKKIIDNGCTLIDYEKISDNNGKRLIFFGKYAGYAGMFDCLHGIGVRYKKEGIKTPFLNIKLAKDYASLEEAKSALRETAAQIREKGLPSKLAPFFIAFLGYGNVSNGAQEILDILPNKTIPPDMLPQFEISATLDVYNIYKIVFKEENLYRRKSDGGFDLQEYYEKPHLYESKFYEVFYKIPVIVNCVYWNSCYPRLITKDILRANSKRLKTRLIADISCDINGAVEITYRCSDLNQPYYTYDIENDTYSEGINHPGVNILAVDNLPCEFPVDSSEEFSKQIEPFINDILNCDFNIEYENLKLPSEIKKAIIVHKGKLTENYRYLENYLS